MKNSFSLDNSIITEIFLLLFKEDINVTVNYTEILASLDQTQAQNPTFKVQKLKADTNV